MTAPVTFEVDETRYDVAMVVSGECVPTGERRTISVRYDPDDPTVNTSLERQYLLYGFAGAAALGFLAALVASVRRLLARRARRRRLTAEGHPPEPMSTKAKVFLGAAVFVMLWAATAAAVLLTE